MLANDAIATLAAHPDYRILRRVDHTDLEVADMSEAAYRLGLVVDIETTGTNHATDQIIELCARFVWATYEGEIVAVGPPRSWLEDPCVPLTPDIVRLTGLTDADLAGQRIDDAAVNDMMIRADFIIAHNASFDRPFIERRFPSRAGLAWCCSCHDVDWPALGFDGRGLGWLLAQCGRFHDGHRAEADVDATIALLRHTLATGRTVWSSMLEKAERPGWQISAVGASFDVKDELKNRNYRWDAKARVWQCEVSDEDVENERGWLAMAVYRPEFRPREPGPTVSSVTWHTRYSSS